MVFVYIQERRHLLTLFSVFSTPNSLCAETWSSYYVLRTQNFDLWVNDTTDDLLPDSLVGNYASATLFR